MLKKIAFGSIGLVFLASPLISSADIVSDLQAQVQALLAQISTLQGQPQPTTPPTISPLPPEQPDDYGNGDTSSSIYCPKLSTTMQRGSRDSTTGGQVSELQTFLTDYFDLDENVVVGGYFGKLTQQYVVKFQSEQGLPSFGIAGQLTRAKIAEVCGGGGGKDIPLANNTKLNVTSPGSATIGSSHTIGWTHSSGPTLAQLARAFPTATGELIAYNNDTSLGVGQTIFRDAPILKLLSGNMIWVVGDKTNDGRAMPAGSYSLVLYVGVPNYGGSTAIAQGSSESFRIDVGSSNTITIIAPNGGEQWDMGVTNTVTWTPYAYSSTLESARDVNPSRDVTAYLERGIGLGHPCASNEKCDSMGYETLGKVQESGKASIHWQTGTLDAATIGDKYAPPGTGYYIRVVNNVTGQWDRSDAPFTILPKPITVMVNGSTERYALADVNTPITVSWTTTSGVSQCQLSGIKEVSFSTPQPSRGSVTGHIEYTLYEGGGVGYGVRLQCQKSVNGVPTQISENAPFYVSYIPQPSTSLQITNPNGGEQIDPTKEMVIKFSSKGLSSASMALYKNDQWKYWIQKDVQPSAKDLSSVSVLWTPSAVLTALGADDNQGFIWKIYVTGQKADGTGYVEDKSDAPFSFVSDAGTLTANPTQGTAPLTVSFNTSAIGGGSYSFTINYGDGQSGPFEKGTTHSYTAPGIYTATLTRSGCPATAASALLALSPPYCPPSEIGKVTVDVKPSTNSNPLSSWGQKLGTNDSDIPNGQFRSYFFKREASGKPGALSRPVIMLDEPYFDYSDGGGYGATTDKQVGAYFVSKSTYGNPSPPIEFDLSNPQWSVARLYIDGQLVHTYGGNSGKPTYSKVFQGGTHTIEIEYESNWHAGTFAARVGRIVQDYVAADSIAATLKALESKHGSLRVVAASVYESGDDVNGDIRLDLPTLTSPTVLVLSSYDPIRWRWLHNRASLDQIKAIVVYSFAGAAIPDLYINSPVYRVRGSYIGDGNGGMTAAMVSQKIGRSVDSFATSYSPTSLTLPAITTLTPIPVATSGSKSFTTPGSHPFTIPAFSTLKVRVWGAGGGGGGNWYSQAGTAGGASSFADSVRASGGSGGGSGPGSSSGGAGGGASGGDTNTSGGSGASGTSYSSGGPGGAGVSGYGNGGTGNDAASGKTAGSGGGAGGYTEKTYTDRNALGSSVTVVVGQGGLGCGGPCSEIPSKNGADGRVEISWTGTSASASTPSANVASAYAAIEAALRAILEKLKNLSQ